MNSANQENFTIKTLRDQKEKLDLENLEKPEKRSKLSKKNIFLIAGGVAFIILLIFAFTLVRGWFSFSKENVKLEIVIPESVVSGEETEIVVKFQNNNRVSLKNVKLILNYPENTYTSEGEKKNRETKNIGEIKAKEQGEKRFKVRLTGEIGSIKTLTARLEYQPENINSSFENIASAKTNIGSVLVGLYLTAPQKAISGEEITYQCDILNNSDKDFSNLLVEVEYPSGFSYKTAEPLPSEEENIWLIEELKQKERTSLSISGSLEGIEEENKIVRVTIYEVKNGKKLGIGNASAITQISSPPISISLFLNEEKQEVVNPGDFLSYTIKFKNNTDVAFSQLVLRAYLEGEMFDYKNLKLRQKGFFDSLNDVIIWSAAGVSSLALLPPSEEGQVNFSVPVKKSAPVFSPEDRNFTLKVRAEIETVNVPPQFNLEKLKIETSLTSKVNSKINLLTKAFYKETSVDISNYGPIPPRVNQLTTYTIHWQITNSTNDLEEARVSSVLPQGVEWKNNYKVFCDYKEVYFNERTNQVVWSIGTLPAGTGFIRPVCEMVFQIGLRPSINQVGTSPFIINESKFEAKDSFTGQFLEVVSPAKSTDLPDDPSVSYNEGKVVE